MKKNQLPLAFAAMLIASQAANSQNTKYGNGAGAALTTGAQNTLVGESSGNFLTTQNGNTHIGHRTGLSSTGAGNTFLGAFAGEANTTGYYNIFFGYATGKNNTTGIQNSFIGNAAGRGISGGSNNTAMGSNAADLTTPITCDGCTFVGYGAKPVTTSTSLNNATAIGANAAVSASNSIVLGDAAAKVGIGISIPSAKLEVNSATAGVSGLKFTKLTSASATAASNGKALSVDATGNVVLVPAGGTATQSNYFATSVGIGVQPNTAYMLSVCGIVRAKEVTVETGWCDYVFEKNYNLRSLPALKQYIATNHHLPEIPSAAEVAQNGVQVASMTSKLLLKVEELTLYVIKQNEKIERLERQLNKKAKK
jgi:trimeric autotransporter adhesin